MLRLMSSPTPTGPNLADQLLDAQVQFVLGELTGDKLAANIERDVADVLAVAADHPLETLVQASN